MRRLNFFFVLCLQFLSLLFFKDVFIDSVWKCVMIHYALRRFTMARLIFQDSLNWSEVLSSSGPFIKIWSWSELGRLIHERLIIGPADCTHPPGYSWVLLHKLLISLFKRRDVVFNWGVFDHVLLLGFFSSVGRTYICKGIIAVHEVLLSL